MRITMIPFGVLSYLLGLTSVRFTHYLVGTSAVMLHILIWLYVGSTLTFLDNAAGATGTNGPSTLEYFALIAQTVIAFGIGIYISYAAKKELDKRLE